MAKSNKISFTWEVLGWFGVILILGAYALSSFNILASNNVAYQVMNLIGGITVGYISFMRKAYQPLTINVIWALVAAVALIGLLA